MSYDSCTCCADDSLVLDVGNIEQDMPFYLMQGLPSREIGLLDTWKLLDIGNRITLRFGTRKDKSDLTQRFYTYQETVEVIKKYPTVFWVPQLFSNPFSATIRSMKVIRSICVDLDCKVDALFWTKTRDMFRAWGEGRTVAGVPAPSLVIFTGNGIHLYWLLAPEAITFKLKMVARITQRMLQLKLSSLFDSLVDPIHIVQALRIPESKTKSGDMCRAFQVQNGFEGQTLCQLATQFFSDEEVRVMNAYLQGEVKFKDFNAILREHGLKSIVKASSKEVEDSVSDEPPVIADYPLTEITEEFNPKSIGVFSSLIDKEPSIMKKTFAKKCVYSIKVQSPLPEGVRDNRLFGLAVALAKCGTKREVLCRIVNMVNEMYCKEPLTPQEVHCTTVNPYKYIRMTEGTLRMQLGIANWPKFSPYKSKMTRKDAAKVAYKLNHKRTVHKLREGYNDLGFDVAVKKLCAHAEIARSTFYNFKDNGILQQEVLNWFINVTNYERLRDSKLLSYLRQSQKQLGNAVDSEEFDIEQFLLAVQSREMADIPT